MPVTARGWEVFSTSRGSHCRTCALSKQRFYQKGQDGIPLYSYSILFLQFPQPSQTQRKWDSIDTGTIWTKTGTRKGSLLHFFFKVVESNFPVCKTILKTDLLLRNCKASALFLWKGSSMLSLLRSFDTRLIISVICVVVAPDTPRGRLEAAPPVTAQQPQ